MTTSRLKIDYLSVEKIKEYGKNAKLHPREQIEQIKKSIEEYGFDDPIALDENGVIIEGHGRLIAAKELGLKTVPVIYLRHLTEEQKKAYRIAHNKINMNSGFDMAMLQAEINEIMETSDVSIEALGFDEAELDEILSSAEDVYSIDNIAESYKEEDISNSESNNNYGEALDEERESLQERFIVPPFSILDTRQGYWQDRKRTWKKIIKSDEGRDDALLGQGLKDLAIKQSGSKTLTGTSIFDPVLCETLINWYCPKGGKVLDPFAGGSVRGLISVLLGNEYTGIDLSEKQIKANIENYKAIADRQDLYGNVLRAPKWINDDSRNIDSLVDEKHDFLLTCPPYADLEVYSDDPRDISNMPYDKFIEAYNDIILKATAKLKDNAFAAIVVGDVRDKKGYYQGFVPDTIEAFKSAGMKHYNECILIEQIATAALRAGKQFDAWRKVVKTHQNVLVFVKGNEKEINLEKHDYNLEEDIA